MANKKFKTQSKQLLDLMINSIYSNKEIFIRELISNASDALTKRNFEVLKSNDDLNGEELKIQLSIDKDQRKLIISDNGIGMNDTDLDSFLGTIANSGTKEFKSDLEDDELNAIGQFGVGFYSSFIVANKVDVLTKKGDQAFIWSSDGVEKYSINESSKENKGTDVILYIRDGEDFDKFLDSDEIKGLVKKHSDFISYPIYMEETVKNEDDSEEVKNNVINSQKAIWKKDKKDQSAELLNDFYKSNFNDFTDPHFVVNANVEGKISFNLLAFIPQKNEFAHMMGEVKNTFKLYSNEVLIEEDASYLLPDYLKFVKGIVDCSDINLNISREMLQQDSVVQELKKSIEKRIIKEFSKLIKKDFAKYTSIWENYSRELTFGVYDNFGAKKDLLKDILIYKNNISEEYVSLKQYVDNNSDQDNILYVVGDNLDVIKSNPMMEYYNENKTQVIYFTNDVDEFAIKTIQSYNDKEFKNILDLSNDDNKDEEVKNSIENNEKLLSTLKEGIGEEVSEVTLTNKLKSVASILTSKNEISIEMEKTLQENNQNGAKAQKVLEINMNHKVFTSLIGKDDEYIKNVGYVLFEQSKLTAGLKLEDPVKYVNLVNDILSK